MARKTMHGMKHKPATAPRSRIPLSAAIRPLAGNEGVPQTTAEPESAVSEAMRMPPAIPAPGIAGGLPSEGPRAMKTGGKTVNEKVLVHRGEKIDVGVDDTIHTRQESPNERDRRDPPVRLKWGVDEDTAEKVNKTSARKLPLGSTVIPAPATSLSISPRGIAQRDQTIRFQF